MEYIINVGYSHKKRVCKDFETKNLGGYNILYVQNYTLLLADVFNNFWNMCFKIYGFDPTPFPSAPGFVWQAA